MGFSPDGMRGLDLAKCPPACFFITSGDSSVSVGYGYGGPGVCLGDGQTEPEGVPSQGGRCDALLRRMSPIPDLMALSGG